MATRGDIGETQEKAKFIMLSSPRDRRHGIQGPRGDVPGRQEAEGKMEGKVESRAFTGNFSLGTLLPQAYC